MAQTPNGIDYFSALPEDCIAAVISFSSPGDACRLASVSKVFNSAVSADPVWKNFLPSDFLEILARSEEGVALYNTLSKKQLFFHLADNPILIDGGTKSFSLEKSTGKKCYFIAARELIIAWGDTPIYWDWHSVPESRFTEVAELTSVCWLDIRGRLRTSMLSHNTMYSAYFVFKLTEGAFGLDQPAKVMIKNNGGDAITRTNVYINPHNQQDLGVLPQERRDGWMEIEIGDFMINGVDEDGEVEMAIMEIRHLNWKRGLIVEGIDIRPKVYAE